MSWRCFFSQELGRLSRWQMHKLRPTSDGRKPGDIWCIKWSNRETAKTTNIYLLIYSVQSEYFALPGSCLQMTPLWFWSSVFDSATLHTLSSVTPPPPPLTHTHRLWRGWPCNDHLQIAGELNHFSCSRSCPSLSDLLLTAIVSKD